MTVQDELAAIAVEAYVYLYPLVMMERHRRQQSPTSPPGSGRASGR